MCRVYGQRPSAVIGIQDEEVALDFDLAMSAVHRAERESRIASAAKQGDAFSGILTALTEL